MSTQINFNNLIKAIKRCLIDGQSEKSTAAAYSIARTTFLRYLKKVKERFVHIEAVDDGQLLDFVRACSIRVPSNQVFSMSQEKELVAYIFKYASYNNGRSMKELRELAFQFGVKLGVRFPEKWTEDKMASIEWYKGFMRRHPQLKLSTPGETSSQHLSENKPCCRTCLQQSVHQMYSLALHNARVEDNNRTKAEEIELADIYNQCTQLIYDPTESQWEWICCDCYEKLVEFFKFRAMCIDSYNKLKENSSVVVEKPDDIQTSFKIEVVDVANILEPNDGISTSDYEHFEDAENGQNEAIEYGHSEIDAGNTEIYIKQCESLNTSIDDDVETPQADEDEDTYDDEYEDINELDQMSDEPIEQIERPMKSAKEVRPVKAPSSDADKSNSVNMIACEKCPKKFFKEHRYEAHLRTHSGLKQWQCEHCEKSFKQHTTLRLHLTYKHYDEAEGKPTFICGIESCGRSLSTKDSLKSHFRKFHGLGKKIIPLPKKICDQCGKSFSSSNSLLMHSYTHTKVTPYKCTTCSKILSSPYQLKVHQMRHDGIKNFICPTCGLRKTTAQELRIHMRNHSKDIKYPCDLCSSVFTQIANMRRHKRIVHCGIKAYSCTHCDRSFGKAETLKHHIMTHTGEKPHACSVCDKRFIQVVALKAHMKVHNKIRH